MSPLQTIVLRRPQQRKIQTIVWVPAPALCDLQLLSPGSRNYYCLGPTGCFTSRWHHGVNQLNHLMAIQMFLAKKTQVLVIPRSTWLYSNANRSVIGSTFQNTCFQPKQENIRHGGVFRYTLTVTDLIQLQYIVMHILLNSKLS